jgi:NAD(P)-dependent dehydrogenase (short-subunit alcohol dehydrogenase family)
MDLHLRNKTVIVTGGAKGIGEAICMVLAEEGAVPVIVDKDETAGEALRKRIGGKSLFINANIVSAESCQAVIGEIVAKTEGEIYGLVNNAGSNDGVGLERGTPEKFVASMNNNAGHFYYMAHYTLPYLKKTRGSMVNISSKTALTGQGNTSGYVAAKGAILALTREWAVELLPYGVRVNAVVPAEVWTPMYETWINTQSNPKEKLASITKKIPFENRMTTAKEIADAVVFLLSSRASHITAQWIHVDGGYVHLDRALTT